MDFGKSPTVWHVNKILQVRWLKLIEFIVWFKHSPPKMNKKDPWRESAQKILCLIESLWVICFSLVFLGGQRTAAMKLCTYQGTCSWPPAMNKQAPAAWNTIAVSARCQECLSAIVLHCLGEWMLTIVYLNLDRHEGPSILVRPRHTIAMIVAKVCPASSASMRGTTNVINKTRPPGLD